LTCRPSIIPAALLLVNVAFYERDPEIVGCLIPVVPEHQPKQHSDNHQRGRLRRVQKRPSEHRQALKVAWARSSKSALDIPTSFIMGWD
jgi:hypothetical protein